MPTGEGCRIAALRKTDRTDRGGRVWSNPDLYPIVGRIALKDIAGSFEFSMGQEAIFELSDVTTLLMLADLKHGYPEKADDEGRVPSFITPRKIVLPSADTVLEASKMLPQQLIVAGDGHDVLRYSKPDSATAVITIALSTPVPH